MRYEMNFQGRCRSCDWSISGDSGALGCWPPFGELPIVRGARIHWWICGGCHRPVCVPDPPPPRWWRIGHPFGRRSRKFKPFTCECGGVFKYWHTFTAPWERVGQPWLNLPSSARCPKCGAPVTLEWNIARDPGLPLIFVFPLVLGIGLAVIVLLPVGLIVYPIVWLNAAIRGKCLHCDSAQYINLPMIDADAGGTLHRCPKCGAWYEVPATGPGPGRRVIEEEVAVRWPEALKDPTPTDREATG